MLKIRLQRTGKRGQAYFRVVVVEHTKKPRGEFLELLGNYDPHKKELKIDLERVNHWISNGAQASPTVNNLLVNYKYWDKPKMASWKPKKRQAFVPSSGQGEIRDNPSFQAQAEEKQEPTVKTDLSSETSAKEETQLAT